MEKNGTEELTTTATPVPAPAEKYRNVFAVETTRWNEFVDASTILEKEFKDEGQQISKSTVKNWLSLMQPISDFTPTLNPEDISKMSIKITKAVKYFYEYRTKTRIYKKGKRVRIIDNAKNVFFQIPFPLSLFEDKIDFRHLMNTIFLFLFANRIVLKNSCSGKKRGEIIRGIFFTIQQFFTRYSYPNKIKGRATSIKSIMTPPKIYHIIWYVVHDAFHLPYEKDPHSDLIVPSESALDEIRKVVTYKPAARK